jgi:hypothetical protein
MFPASVFSTASTRFPPSRGENQLLYHPSLRQSADKEQASTALGATSNARKAAGRGSAGAGSQIAHCYGKPFEQPISQRPHLGVE